MQWIARSIHSTDPPDSGQTKHRSSLQGRAATHARHVVHQPPRRCMAHHHPPGTSYLPSPPLATCKEASQAPHHRSPRQQRTMPRDSLLPLATARQRMPGPPPQSLCHSKQTLARFQKLSRIQISNTLPPYTKHDYHYLQRSAVFELPARSAHIQPSLIASADGRIRTTV
jgi:hypothetical protein